MVQITNGVLHSIVNAAADDEIMNSQPIVQILSVKKINNPPGSNAPERYRIILSDGTYFSQSMLSTQLNHLVTEAKIQKHTIIQLTQIVCSLFQNKKVIIIMALQTLEQVEDKIGNPVSVDTMLLPVSEMATRGPAAQVPQAPVQQQPAPPNQVAQNGQSRRVVPIEGLNPYSNQWTIRALVSQKSDIIRWSKATGEGKLFNVTLVDQSSAIRATGFNAVLDKFYDMLHVGKVYYISKGRVNMAKKKFSTLPNEYELSFEAGTEIEECLDQEDLPTIKYQFVELSQLESKPKDSSCDVIGVVKGHGDLGEIVSKATSRSVPKRELTLVDRSGYSVRLTLWGKQAQDYNVDGNPVIAFKDVKVGDFGGRSLSMVSSSMMTIEPDIAEAHALRGWFDSSGTSEKFHSHSTISPNTPSAFNRAEVRTIAEVKDSGLGNSDKVEFFSIRATIIHIKQENISYPACPKEGCNKKVVDVGDGWRCEKCERTYPAPEYRYIVALSVADHSGQAWLQGFNDVGLAVFGISANELVELRERDEAGFLALFAKANLNTYNFSCRAKQDTYNGNSRVRYGITRMETLDYLAEASALRDMLNSDWAK